jgi:hypothetical protein
VGNATPAPPELPSDPCALLTVHDVESATGAPVSRAEAVPVDNLMGPQFPTCRYRTPRGPDGSISISVDPHGAATFAQYRDRDPNNLAVDDIGDEALVHGVADLWVRVDDGFFTVSTQLNPGTSGVKTLKQLALDALGHLAAS